MNRRTFIAFAAVVLLSPHELIGTESREQWIYREAVARIKELHRRAEVEEFSRMNEEMRAHLQAIADGNRISELRIQGRIKKDWAKGQNRKTK